jgi:hypothetical protein
MLTAVPYEDLVFNLSYETSEQRLPKIFREH